MRKNQNSGQCKERKENVPRELEKVESGYFGEYDLYYFRISFKSGTKLPNKIFIFGMTVAAVVIIVGGVSWTLFNSNQPAAAPSDTTQPSNQPESQNPEVPTDTSPGSSDNPTNSSNSESSALPEEQVKDAAMTYIKTAHAKTAPLMTDLSWTGGRLETEDPNTETYIYYAANWEVTIEWPLVSNPTYTVSASYRSEETQIVWQGTFQNGNIKETSYTDSP